jgi:hypothetical protein
VHGQPTSTAYVVLVTRTGGRHQVTLCANDQPVRTLHLKSIKIGDISFYPRNQKPLIKLVEAGFDDYVRVKEFPKSE